MQKIGARATQTCEIQSSSEYAGYKVPYY